MAVISENKTDPKQALVNRSLSREIISAESLLDAAFNNLFMDINNSGAEMKSNQIGKGASECIRRMVIVSVILTNEVKNQSRIAEVLVLLLKRN